MADQPTGKEREVKSLGGAAIDGAPVAYIVVLAAVVAALAFIPMSVVMASGGSFPMNQGVLSVLGWVLGPVAGALSAFIGALIGVFIAPHTAGVPAVTILGAVITAFVAGSMVIDGKRSWWWLPITIVVVIAYFVYIGRAFFINGVSLQSVILGSFINWSAILLWVLPTRKLLANMIKSESVPKLAAGLFLGTWMSFGLAHACQCAITYTMFNWPEEVWIMLIPMMPFENAMRALVATVVGSGVIIGLRAIGIVRPEKAVF
jgi:hypothetical protein